MVRFSSKSSKESGAVMLEFTMLLILGALPVFLMVDFGASLRQKQIITDAARQGARTAATVYSRRIAELGLQSIPSQLIFSNPDIAEELLDQPPAANLTCAQIFSKYPEDGAVPDFIDSAAKWRSCRYLQASGQNSAEWDISPQITLAPVTTSSDPPDNFFVNEIRVIVGSSDSTCLLCLGPARLLMPQASSVFILG